MIKKDTLHVCVYTGVAADPSDLGLPGSDPNFPREKSQQCTQNTKHKQNKSSDRRAGTIVMTGQWDRLLQEGQTVTDLRGL